MGAKAAAGAPDMNRIEAATRVAIDAVRAAEGRIVKLNGELATVTETARARRLELGKLLVQARGAWPERGPRAKGWGEYLVRLQIDQQRAWEFMRYAGYVGEVSPNVGEISEGLPTLHEAGVIGSPTLRLVPDLVDTDPDVANVYGGSRELARGKYCTPPWITEAVGHVDVDPFGNDRSTVQAEVACWLERGDNGISDGGPGSYYTKADGRSRATPRTKAWIQPPYEIVLEAIAHYGHTRFIALLRFDTSTEWFAKLFTLSETILLFRKRVDFRPPPGILAPDEDAAGAPFPHALFYARTADVTPAIRDLCFTPWVTRG